jgi:UDP-2,4-diacetamido-2,4,6-trideoxy-beta-L-altropyranose hydrolase
MNIVFRVDSSSEIGAGHLMRCLTLANKLKKNNHKAIFICRKLKGDLILLIKHPVLILSSNDNFQSDDLYLNFLGATQEQDASQTIGVLPERVDVLIVDSYALDEEWHQRLRAYVDKIMVIDDLANKQFDCDMLLNQNLGIQKKDYKNKVPVGCELLMGCDYALLRPEFSKLRGQALEKRKRTKRVENVLISIGGSDVDNVTLDILKKLDNGLNIVVVLGLESPHNAIIKKYIKGKNIEVIINADDMSGLMMNADLMIGAAGSTSWERCCLGLPVLLYVLAENQKAIAGSLEKLGAAIITKDLKSDICIMVSDLGLWHDMSNKAKNICDGLGVIRVFNKLC